MSAPAKERPAALTPHQRAGVTVLLVYGLKVPVPRDGQPGFRLTVQVDGAVHCDPVGFDSPGLALRVAARLQRKCREIGLRTIPLTNSGAFVVRKEAPCPS